MSAGALYLCRLPITVAEGWEPDRDLPVVRGRSDQRGKQCGTLRRSAGWTGHRALSGAHGDADKAGPQSLY